MNTGTLLNLIDRAMAAGLLPATAREHAAGDHERPWPVVALTFIGAFLAAIPLAGFFLLVFESWLHESTTYYLIGGLLVALGIVLMRMRAIPLFFEQWGVIAFATGFGMLWFVLVDDLHMRSGHACVSLLALGFALALPAAWMRASLALLAGLACAFALLGESAQRFNFPTVDNTLRVRLVILFMVAAWWAGLAAIDRLARSGGSALGHAQRLNPILDGWLIATLALVILSVGNTFLMGSFGGRAIDDIGHELLGRGIDGAGTGSGPRLLGVACALLGAGLLLRAWAALRSPLGLGLAAAAIALSWAITALGPVVLIGAVCALTTRRRMAILAGAVAVWALGAFYYALSMPLATKALVLTGIGASLGLLAWLQARRLPAPAPAPAAPPAAMLDFSVRGASAFVLAGLVAVLGVANYAILDKERLIAQGQRVYLELAPVDPRSLMQGDYMALNFRIPTPDAAPAETFGSRRPTLLATLDDRGVVTTSALADGKTPSAPNQLLIELTPGRRNDWQVVTDAWFFREGQAERWAAARYGEFRVLPDGRALLVGMADAQLRQIE